MDFNLSKLLKAINGKFSYPKDGAVEFLLAEECIIAKMGEVGYYFDHKKLQAVLDGTYNTISVLKKSGKTFYFTNISLKKYLRLMNT